MEFLFIDYLPFETPLRWFILKVKIAFALLLCVLCLHRLPDDDEISTPESPCLLTKPGNRNGGHQGCA